MSNFRITVQLTSKEMGQLKSLMKFLGEFTRDVIEWMLNPVNWFHFSLQVKTESGLHHVPSDPDIGFLLVHRNRALRIMRRELRDSKADADVRFCTRLDQLRYEQMKELVLVLSEGKPEWADKIKEATTLTDIQRVFIELPVAVVAE